MIAFIFQFKSKFAKVSDKTANFLKPTDYFNNQQNISGDATREYSHQWLGVF